MKTIFEQLSGKQLSPEDIDNQYFAWIAGQYNLDDTEQSPDKMSAKEMLNKTISEIDDIVAKDSDLSKSKELRDSLKVWNDSESDNMFNIQTEQLSQNVVNTVLDQVVNHDEQKFLDAVDNQVNNTDTKVTDQAIIFVKIRQRGNHIVYYHRILMIQMHHYI